MMTSDDYKAKRILDISKQIRSLKRKVTIEEEKKKKLDKLVSLNKSVPDTNVKDSLASQGVFMDSGQPLDNEITQVKNK